MVLGTIYSLWVYNRISYGQLKEIYIISFKDIDRQEFIVFLPLVLATLVVGIYPELILKSLHMSVECFLCQIMN
jgi:NADH-ubiquinone oxidoreductase chain 4